MNIKDFQLYFYSLLSNYEHFSLSELSIDKKNVKFVTAGVDLAFIHYHRYLHKDLHREHVLFSMVTGSSRTLDCGWKKSKLSPSKMFEDFIPPFISLNKSEFIAFLIGYFKSAFTILDFECENYSVDLLLLLGAKTTSIVRQTNEFQSLLDTEIDIDTFVSYELRKRKDSSFFEKLKSNYKFTSKIFFLLINLYENSNNIFEYDFLVEFRGNILNSENTEKIVSSLLLVKELNTIVKRHAKSDRLANPNFKLLSHTINQINQFESKVVKIICERIILMFDCMAIKFDKLFLSNNLDKKLKERVFELSIIYAQISLMILQKIKVNLQEYESIELEIKSRHIQLSWYAVPEKNWYTKEKLQLERLNGNDSVKKMEIELNKLMSYVNKLALRNTFINEFQYFYSLVMTLNESFLKSIKEFKLKKVTNLLWTNSFRAMSYSRRNILMMAEYLLASFNNSIRLDML